MKTLLLKLEEDLRRKQRDLIKFFALTLIFILLVALIFYFPYFHVIGSLDASMPYRFYLWIKPSSDPEEKDLQIRKYRYVEVFVGDLTQYKPIREKRVLYFIKEVACFPGDYLLAKGGKFFCNGKLFALAHPQSPSPPISYNGRIPKGMYFLLGKHFFSFDSRYIGLISINRVTGVLIPLF